MGMNCQNCTYCLKTESPVMFRCGFEYFQKPPSERRPERLDHYPQVDALGTCAKWADEVNPLLRQGMES